MKSKNLQFLTWSEAKDLLNSQSVLVVPLGAQCKEHGHHLPLNTDWLMAEALKKEIEGLVDAVFAPTINYSYYPNMVKYPGTVSLGYDTTIGMVTDICNSFARFGVRKFYILNTGISTLKPLKSVAERLGQENIVLTYTDLNKILCEVQRKIQEQEGGGHADEVETSIMLSLCPQVVDMKKARKDFSGAGAGQLTPVEDGSGVYSPTGAWGDPRLATNDKGKKLVDALVKGIVKEIKDLQLR